MSDREPPGLSGLGVDTENLYREESFTDLRAASVRRLTPVNSDGSTDINRATLFIGETSLMTQVGALPINCQIEANSLKEAFEQFPTAIQAAVEQLSERAEEMRRDEASRIVVPTAVPPGMGGGLPGAGGMPGGGKIVLK